jgi:hypothetical protein
MRKTKMIMCNLDLGLTVKIKNLNQSRMILQILIINNIKIISLVRVNNRMKYEVI